MGAIEVLRIAAPLVNEALSFAEAWHTHEYTASIRNGNDNHVRGTCGESLFPLSRRWYSQNGANNAYRRESLMPMWRAEGRVTKAK